VRRLLLATALASLACGGLPDPDASPPPSGGAVDPTGTWAEPTTTYMVGYDGTSCPADGGSWAEDRCLFASTNTATFTPTGQDGVWTVQIDTIGANAHLCSLEGEARQSDGVLVVSAPTEVYDAESDSFREAACAFPVRIDGGTLSFEGDGEACRSFCGARAYLGISAARRE